MNIKAALQALSVLMALVTMLCAHAVSAANRKNHEGWNAFPRREMLLKDNYTGNYEREAIKTDYFIFQKTVSIDEILYSNGGDVLIVADDLFLNAPIDTRVRFRMGPNYWAVPKSGTQGDGTTWSSLEFAIGRDPENLRAFDSLYLWRELYNPATKQYEYGAASRPTASPPSVVELPQLPSAQVPLASPEESGHSYKDVRPSNGEDAPDAEVIWQNTRSGRIQIFASKIHLCDACKDALFLKIPLNPIGFKLVRSSLADRIQGGEKFVVKAGGYGIPIGDPFDVNQAVFLQASGLKGGRGGAGSFYHSTLGDLSTKPGGLSGKPGRGGDAGNVEIHVVNRTLSDEERSLLTLAASAQGGVPAQSHQQRSVNVVETRRVQNRAAFQDEVPISNLLSLVGKSGMISLDSLNTDSALGQISDRLLDAELNGNYSIKLVVESANSNPSLFSIFPMDGLRTLLAEELVRIQDLALRLTIPALAGVNAKPIALSSFFETLSCNPIRYSGLLSDQQKYLQRLCEFRQFKSEEPLRSFLFRTGGVYLDVPTDINSWIRHQDIVTELNRTQKLLAVAVNEIVDVHLLTYDAVTEAQKQALLAVIEKLQAQRKALQEAYEASLEDSSHVISVLVEIGKNFGEAYGSIVSSNWVNAGEKLRTGLTEFADTITANRIPAPGPDFYSIDSAIKEAQAVLAAFVASVELEREEILGSKYKNLKELMATNARLQRYREMAHFSFGDFLRGSIQEYFQTSDIGVLRANLTSISDVVDGIKNPSPLNIRSLRALCRDDQTIKLSLLRGEAGCVEFSRDTNRYAIVARKPGFDGIPLLVVEPGAGLVTRSLERVFSSDEIVRIEMED